MRSCKFYIPADALAKINQDIKEWDTFCESQFEVFNKYNHTNRPQGIGRGVTKNMESTIRPYLESLFYNSKSWLFSVDLDFIREEWREVQNFNITSRPVHFEDRKQCSDIRGLKSCNQKQLQCSNYDARRITEISLKTENPYWYWSSQLKFLKNRVLTICSSSITVLMGCQLYPPLTNYATPSNICFRILYCDRLLWPAYV